MNDAAASFAYLDADTRRRGADLPLAPHPDEKLCTLAILRCAVVNVLQERAHNVKAGVSVLVTTMAAFVWLSRPLMAQAQYSYTTAGDNTITITGYTGPSNIPVVIPGTLNGLPVTTLAMGSFNGLTNLPSVVIPNSVTNLCPGFMSFGTGAFNGCSGLTNVIIGGNVRAIGPSCFQSCSKLTAIAIPDSVKFIDAGAFEYCFSLKQLAIGNGVKTIMDNAFLQCSSLQNVTIPNSVTYVAKAAFSLCSSMTNLVIGTNVAWLGNNVFGGCSNLTSVTIPDSVTKLGDAAGMNPYGSSMMGCVLFQDCVHLTNVVLGNGLTNIGEEMFMDCPSLASITIPANVKSIDPGAFLGCSALSRVYLAGNAPALNNKCSNYQSPFTGLNPTVYCNPQASGWSGGNVAFGTLPAAPWNPSVAHDANFGLKANRFGFSISGAPGYQCVVAVCTNLTTTNWAARSTLVLTNGTGMFSDASWSNRPVSFYRLQAP